MKLNSVNSCFNPNRPRLINSASCKAEETIKSTDNTIVDFTKALGKKIRDLNFSQATPPVFSS
jgi:hypothetical protein